VATILTHTIQGLLLGGLLVGIAVSSWARGGRLPWSMLGVVLTTMIAAIAFVVFYLLPVGRGWNTGETWGMGPAGGVRGAVYLIGWPVCLLAAVGAVLLLSQKREQGAYWLAWAGLWFAASAALPMFVVYHYAYVFPLSLGVVVLAGAVVGEIYSLLRVRSTVAGWVWIGAACSLNGLSLLSHYSDGSRYDYRTAARYIAKNWQAGDRVAAVAGGALPRYEAVCDPTIHLTPKNVLSELQELCKDRQRTWIVLNSDRGGLDPKIAFWLHTHCSNELTVRAKRYDYRDYVVDVFLFPRFTTDGRSARVTANAPAR
jgi:hypothetical protein